MTDKEFAVVVSVLKAGAPDKHLSRPTLDLWFELLGDLPAGVVLQAVKAHYATSEYPTLPAIGAVRKAAVSLMRPAALTGSEAWKQVMSEVSRVGSYGSPDRLDTVTRRVVDSIGWRNICESEELGVERGQFLRMYQQVLESDQRDAALPKAMRPGAMAPALPASVQEGLDAIGQGGRVVPMGRDRS